MNRTKSVACMLVLVLGLATSEAKAQHSEHGTLQELTLEQLGQVNFSVSCNAKAQKDFNRAMALFHSFGFISA